MPHPAHITEKPLHAYGVALVVAFISCHSAAVLAVPSGTPSLPVFCVDTAAVGAWSQSEFIQAYTAFFHTPSCSIAQLSLTSNVTVVSACFQFNDHNAASESQSLIATLAINTSFSALQDAFRPYMTVESMNYTMPSTSTPTVASSGSWVAQNPEIVAGIAAGAIILIVGVAFFVVQRRSKRQEQLREAMEAIMGDKDLRAAAAGERADSPTPAPKKGRAPAPSTGKSAAPAQNRPNEGYVPPPPPPPQGSRTHRDRLVSFYSKHNPSKLSTVDKTLLAYQGREEELFSSLRLKYGPEPEPTATVQPTAPSDGGSATNGSHQPSVATRSENGHAEIPQATEVLTNQANPAPESN